MSAFREIASRFADKNAQVLGVSMDDAETQKKFADSLKLPFPLLADPKGEVVKAYGVEMQRDGKTYADRVTFVIDSGGKVTKVLAGKDALDPAPALDACPLHHKKT
jgi:thioredoxin-dependent peroxiredoxin